jgi:hypothetical protein
MATKPMNMVDAVAETIPRLARNRSAVLRFGRVATVPANGLVKVNVGTSNVTCAYLYGVELVVADWVAIINDSDRWLVIGKVMEPAKEYRPVPFAMQGGDTIIVIPANVRTANMGISYEVGRFTAVPVVVGCTHTYATVFGAFGPSNTTSFLCYVGYADGSTAGTPFNCHAYWHAVQMTSTSSLGREAVPIPEDWVTVHGACTTAGCGNQGADIEFVVPDPQTPLACGVCGQSIEGALA